MSSPYVQPPVTLRAVDKTNWREVARLVVSLEQRAFVAQPSYYLACRYDLWNPLAIYAGEQVVGFTMWAVDDDTSCWLGGILIDHTQQRRGYGRKAVIEAVSMLRQQDVCPVLPTLQQRRKTALPRVGFCRDR